MTTLLPRELLNRAAVSLVLLLAGSAGFALTAQDSWIALTALLASLGGLALLYGVIRRVRERFTGRARSNAARTTVAAGCANTVGRAVLILVLGIAAIAWVWFAASDMNEVRMLAVDPRFTQAQVIGKELVDRGVPTGYVHYAYRVTPSLAPEDRFAVPYSTYKRYWTGASIAVTYAAAAPRIHRIGHITGEYAIRRALYWLLLLGNGAAFLFLPLWLLQMQRRPQARLRRP